MGKLLQVGREEMVIHSGYIVTPSVSIPLFFHVCTFPSLVAGVNFSGLLAPAHVSV